MWVAADQLSGTRSVLSGIELSARPHAGAREEASVWRVFAGEDEATFSVEALERARADEEVDKQSLSGEAEEGEETAGTEKSGVVKELTPEERQMVEELRARDAEVRTHEAAHMAAGGSHVRGGATYTYQTGPDGKSYAIGGEVGIDVSTVPNNPEATIQKMQQIRAAALAPSEPSGADRAVASKAAQLEAQAREQLAARNAERVTSRYSEAEEPAPGSVFAAAA